MLRRISDRGYDKSVRERAKAEKRKELGSELRDLEAELEWYDTHPDEVDPSFASYRNIRIRYTEILDEINETYKEHYDPFQDLDG